MPRVQEKDMKRLFAMAFACALMAATSVNAQNAYPTRSIKIVCGFPAGSSLDVITRIYADKIEKALGQPVVVENRVGPVTSPRTPSRDPHPTATPW